MTAAKKRGDEMADQKDKWADAPKASASTMRAEKSNQERLPGEKMQGEDKKEDEFFHDETEKDGVKTVISSVDQEEANKVKKVIESLPQHLNQRQSFDGVPGWTNLTSDGTLNTDRTERQDPEKLNELIEKTAGPNPFPNREGNELTKIEQSFRADTIAWQGQSLKGYAKTLKELREKGTLNDEDKKKLESIEKGLSTGA